jgi:hypothetical protein
MTQLCAAMLAGKDRDMRINLPPPAIFRVSQLIRLSCMHSSGSSTSSKFVIELTLT